ncbi:MAG: hypothetical protein WCT14_14090 [Treponemataceae bacterium]
MSCTIQDRKSRFQAFWEKANGDRPLFGFQLPERNLYGERLGLQTDIDLDRLCGEAIAAYDETALIEQDSLWAAEPPSAVPWVETSVDSGCDSYERVVRGLSAAALGRFPIGQAELHGPTKVLNALFGENDLRDRLKNDQKTIIDLISKIEKVQITLLKKTFGYSACKGGHVLGGLHLWAPGSCVLLRDEDASLFSRTNYERFFLPSIIRSAACADFAVFSLGSDCLHILDLILEIESIQCIDFRLEIGAPPLVDLLPLLRRIQESGRCLSIHGPTDKEDIDSILSELSYGGLYLRLAKGTAVEARFWANYILTNSRA